MNVLMTGGGTGGHVYPAVAIANTIKANIPDANVAFVGTPEGMENRICQSEGFKMYHAKAMGISRSLSPRNVKALYLALTSPRRAKKILDDFKPDIVIGTGGYACWPIMKAASDAGIPTMVHESNVLPGMAVRMLQTRVDRILLNFSETANLLDKADREKIITVGNPLRRGFSVKTYDDARRELGIPESAKVVLSYGGSLGATRINEVVFDFMKEYDTFHPETIHFHSTGKNGREEMHEKLKASGLDKYENIKVFDYINDMPTYIAAADVIICRAGAMTVSEISMMNKAAVFIPSPNVADNHQYKNAKLLADNEAALLIEEKDLNCESLTEKVSGLLENDEYRKKISSNASKFSNPDANRLIYDEALKLVGKYMDKTSGK